MEIISITHTFQFITKRYRVWEPQSQPHISLCNQISLKFNMFLFACDHRHARFVIQKNKTAINTHALAVANAKICLNGCQILYLFYLLFILIIHTVNAILISRMMWIWVWFVYFISIVKILFKIANDTHPFKYPPPSLFSSLSDYI